MTSHPKPHNNPPLHHLSTVESITQSNANDHPPVDAKIFFQGKYVCDPNTSNNNGAHSFNKGSLKLYKVGDNGQLTDNFTDEEFRNWQQNTPQARSWNLYGSHSFNILETSVTAGEIDFNYVTKDDLVGKNVSLLGHELATQRVTPKMVDQGEDILTSQIFADKLILGDEANNITIGLPIGNFRTYNPNQVNFDAAFPNEKGSGNFYFTCKAQDITFHGSSPLVANFQKALAGKFGVRVWFVLLNTIHIPRGTYHNTSAPAYGSLYGWVTTLDQSQASKLEDRYLIPVTDGNAAVSLFVNEQKQTITLDMMAVPFSGRDDKLYQLKCDQIREDFKKNGMNSTLNLDPKDVPILKNREAWSLNLKFQQDDGKVVDFGKIPLEVDAKAVNNNVVNVSYQDDIDFSKGTFLIVDSEGKNIFKERDYSYYVDTPFGYTDHFDQEINPAPFRTNVHAFYRGQPATYHQIYLFPFTDLDQYPDSNFSSTEPLTWNNLSPIMLKFARFEPSYPVGSVGSVTTDGSGTATIELFGTGCGCQIISISPNKYPATKTEMGLDDYINGSWFAVRVLSYDAHLLKVPYEQRIKWDFVYEHVLRFYYLMYPFMNDRILALNQVENAKGYALFIYKATQKEAWTKSWYMPASREMSDTRRQILQEYLSSFTVIPTDVQAVPHPAFPVRRSDFQVFTREQLLYQLCQAADQEHALMLQYLFAAYTLKDLPEENLPPEALQKVQSVKSTILHIAQQEMLHFGIVSNIINAIGGTTHAFEHNFPRESRFWKGLDGGKMIFALEKLDQSSIDKFVQFEHPEISLVADTTWKPVYEQMSPVDKQFNTLGELYSWLRNAFEKNNIPNLFIGKKTSQVNGVFATNGREQFGALFNINNAQDAIKGIDLIVEQGEGNPRLPKDNANTHYQLFKGIQADIANWQNYVRPVVTNPAIRLRDDVPKKDAKPTSENAGQVNPRERVHLIQFKEAAFTYCTTIVCESLYENLLRLVVGFWSGADDTKPETTALYRMLTGYMKQVFRPIAEALTLLPVNDKDLNAGNAGPSFDYYDSLHVSHTTSTFVRILQEQISMCTQALDTLIQVARNSDTSKITGSFFQAMNVSESPQQKSDELVNSAAILRKSWPWFEVAVSKMERCLEGLKVLVEYMHNTFDGKLN